MMDRRGLEVVATSVVTAAMNPASQGRAVAASCNCALKLVPNSRLRRCGACPGTPSGTHRLNQDQWKPIHGSKGRLLVVLAWKPTWKSTASDEFLEESHLDMMDRRGFEVVATSDLSPPL